ncbi:metallophosphoesterase family protein [Lyngbya confervoides]
MQARVRWQDSLCHLRNIDQTRLIIDDGQAEDSEFSFLVVGDSGSGFHRGDSPQRRIAQSMMAEGSDCRFVLHTGDVIYLVGSSEQYFENFIKPYREYLVGGDRPEEICYDRMVFKRPFLPVPGNHDYYDLPLILGVISQATLPLRYLLRSQLDIDVGWHGSYSGDAYARAFLDYLKDKNPQQLEQHLARHYGGDQRGSCLRYQPGQFTRLPNRYYRFRYGGIDFFALDSNTFNSPEPIPAGQSGTRRRRQLEQQRTALEQDQLRLLGKASRSVATPGDRDQLHDLYAKAEQLSEQIRDIDKQLAAATHHDVDHAQLRWLKQELVVSWGDPDARGRILFFHHPPYVTEATKWDQGQTLAIRYHLQQVFDAVDRAIAPRPQNHPLVDLVLNGHAHCLEHLQTQDTGHADSYLNWIVCGGSGFSLRRQRPEGPALIQDERILAKSLRFVGRSGHGSEKRRPYSYLRIDVAPGSPPPLTVRPFIVELFQKQWRHEALPPFSLTR